MLPASSLFFKEGDLFVVADRKTAEAHLGRVLRFRREVALEVGLPADTAWLDQYDCKEVKRRLQAAWLAEPKVVEESWEVWDRAGRSWDRYHAAIRSKWRSALYHRYGPLCETWLHLVMAVGHLREELVAIVQNIVNERIVAGGRLPVLARPASSTAAPADPQGVAGGGVAKARPAPRGPLGRNERRQRAAQRLREGHAPPAAVPPRRSGHPPTDLAGLTLHRWKLLFPHPDHRQARFADFAGWDDL